MLRRENPSGAQDTVRAAVVGVGAFGRHHARKYAELDGAELAAVVDLDADAAARVAEPFGAPTATRLEDVLPGVDAVSIAAPAAVHGRIARQCLEAGKHVLVEKPIALDLDEADALLALAQERDLVVQVGHQERYVLEDFGLLAQGAVPSLVEARRVCPYTGRCVDVSVVLDMMIHDIDMAHAVAPGALETVEADGGRVHGPHFDRVDARLWTQSGTEIRLAASRVEEGRERVMRLVYPDGEIALDFMSRTLTNTTQIPVEAAFGGDTAGGAPAIADDPLGYSIAQFIQSVCARTRPLVSGEDGRRALDTALRIMAAAGEDPAAAQLR